MLCKRIFPAFFKEEYLLFATNIISIILVLSCFLILLGLKDDCHQYDGAFSYGFKPRANSQA